MTDPRSSTTSLPRKRWSRMARSLVTRLWVLAIMVVAIWTAYLAGSYMVEVVFALPKVPLDILDRRLAFKPDDLRATSSVGLTTAAPRAPIGHYHGVERWFQPDLHNGCTVSGCHQSLPHARSKETRAFANMHATFLHCQICHTTATVNPLKTAWIDTRTGHRQDAPAVLQLIRELEINADRILVAPDRIHEALCRLLAQAVQISGPESILEYFSIRLNTAAPGSAVWRQPITQLAEELPNQARGEYGAKIALDTLGDPFEQANDRRLDQARRSAGLRPGSPERMELVRQAHSDVETNPDSCLPCHGGQPARLDWQFLGYPPKRQAELSNLIITRMIQQNRQGQPFYWPGMLNPVGSAASLPSSRP